MLETSKNANPNYLCKVVALKGLKKHPNADRLQTVTIDFNTVITGLDAKEGDIYVYFPVECEISRNFLGWSNSFRDKALNVDPEKVGFFEDSCRVKAMKLRGEKSMGYIVPSFHVAAWANCDIFPEDEGKEFDTIGGKLLVKKFQVPVRGGAVSKQGKKPNLSRLVEGQVHLHIDTENLRKNAHKVSPSDLISITYKIHGTSWWVSNVLVKRKLSFLERLLKRFGVNVSELVYDLVYGSRKVVKNANLEDPKAKDHFFGYDLWEDVKNQVGEFIPKGWTLYGEMVGYDKNGKAIQAGYDYGCYPYSGNVDRAVDIKPSSKIVVYRITNTTPDGLVTELSYPEIRSFCDKVGLSCSHLFYYGTASNWYCKDLNDIPSTEGEIKEWREEFIQYLEQIYNEKDCFQCTNKVPEEGVVIRVEDLFECKTYKLKSFRFLEWESSELDKGVIDTESEN